MAASGTFAEETVVPAIGAVKISDEIPLTSAALIGCGVLTGVGAALNTASIRPGDSVAVVGAGGVGLNVIQGAKLAGAERIIAVDMVEGKLERARDFGATDAVDASDGNAVARVQELTSGRGADVAFEVIGLEATVMQTFEMARRGGQAIIVGVPKMESRFDIDVALSLVMGEKQFGAVGWVRATSTTTFPMLAGIYQEGKLKLDELVSRTISLDRERGFDALAPARSPGPSSTTTVGPSACPSPPTRPARPCRPTHRRASTAQLLLVAMEVFGGWASTRLDGRRGTGPTGSPSRPLSATFPR